MLANLPESELPSEYLVSRLQGRRVSRGQRWKTLAGSGTSGRETAEHLWQALRSEYRWVYTHMCLPLRRQFSFFFLVAEAKIIFSCLRLKAANDYDSLNKMLTDSLLAKPIRVLLLDRQTDSASVIRAAEILLRNLLPRFPGIDEADSKGNLRRTEEKVTAAIFSGSVKEKRLHPILIDYFKRIIDLRNIIWHSQQFHAETRSQLPTPLEGGYLSFARGGKRVNLVEKTLPSGYHRLLLNSEKLSQAAVSLHQAAFHKKIRSFKHSSAIIGQILCYLVQLHDEFASLSMPQRSFQADTPFRQGEEYR